MKKKPDPTPMKRPDHALPEPYEPPSIRVFTEEEILSQLGPAQLYSGNMPFEF